MITINKLPNPRWGDPGAGKFDARYAIVRSMSHKIDGFETCDILSPGKELFNEYWKLERSDRDNEAKGVPFQKLWTPEKFQSWYLPEFLSQMRYDPRAAKVLNGLVELDKAGANIELCCFCKKESDCHRSIVAGLLQGAGANVKTQTGKDYSKYFEMYKEAPLTWMAARYLNAEGVRPLRPDKAPPSRQLGSAFDINSGDGSDFSGEFDVF